MEVNLLDSRGMRNFEEFSSRKAMVDYFNSVITSIPNLIRLKTSGKYPVHWEKSSVAFKGSSKADQPKKSYGALSHRVQPIPLNSAKLIVPVLSTMREKKGCGADPARIKYHELGNPLAQREANGQ
jgi:hypothetical protein